jgi:putative (di)nucleoside polyphosphate hydrolase
MVAEVAELVMRFTGAERDINIDTGHPEFDEWKCVRSERLPELVVRL